MENATTTYNDALTEILPLQQELKEIMDNSHKIFGKPHHGKSAAIVSAREKYAAARKSFDKAIAETAEKFGKTPDEVHIDLTNLLPANANNGKES